ncbi:hypothetical protein JCGZ_09501 [Jatropha curcas]|uniref:Uncharacterized protein n=1 Tax=Jatropha curcas TaxID=180498 RepID=A0A067KNA0_JATCU|nr:hypothetical protein JCGZ_09501 [Jatropha curcas]
MTKSRALPEVASATYVLEDSKGIKTQVTSATFKYVSMRNTPESQRVYKQRSQARHSTAQAQEAPKRGREFLSTSRERDHEPRERDSCFQETLITTLSPGNHVFPCIGIMLDTIYNASRHQGKVTLGVGSMASIFTYVAHMPIPPYRAQPIDIFRRVGQGDRDEGNSHAQAQRQWKGKAPVTSSPQADEEHDEVAGWKQVLSKVDALRQSQENLQVTVFDMGQQLHKILKNQTSMARKWMKYFQKQNIEFTPSPPRSPEA